MLLPVEYKKSTFFFCFLNHIFRSSRNTRVRLRELENKKKRAGFPSNSKSIERKINKYKSAISISKSLLVTRLHLRRVTQRPKYTFFTHYTLYKWRYFEGGTFFIIFLHNTSPCFLAFALHA